LEIDIHHKQFVNMKNQVKKQFEMTRLASQPIIVATILIVMSCDQPNQIDADNIKRMIG